MTTATKRKARRTPAEREAIARESLRRARSGGSTANDVQVIAAFMARGIPAADITPRENVLTYHAWRALGRQVRRGEHGEPVVTWIEIRDKATGQPKRTESGAIAKRPKTARVFHISQTDPIEAPTA